MKMRIFTFFVALLCLPLVSWGQSSTYDGGSGTDTDPYQINTPEQLKALATAVNGGTDYANTHFKLTAPINLNNEEWKPIGNATNKPFKGIFDGNNQAITGFSITNAGNCLGLFGAISEGAELKNIQITEGSISVSNLTSTVYLGGICGNCYKGTITSCSSALTITITNAPSQQIFLGGICGNIESGTITECHNTGDISKSGAGYYYSTGGIVGGFQNSTLSNSYNTGNISLTNSSYGEFAGGLCGYTTNGTVTSCYNTGNISASGGNTNVIGGIIGYVTGEKSVTKYSYNAGNIQATDMTSSEVGGIIGRVYDKLSDRSAEITGCFNVGSFSLGTGIGDRLGAGFGFVKYESVTCQDNAYLEKSGLPNIGVDNNNITTDVDEMTPAEITAAINQQLTVNNGWNTSATYINGIIALPKLNEESEDDITIALPLTITLPKDTEHGTITTDKETVTAGETVTLTITPNEGYELESLTINGETISITSNTYTFTPTSDVTITAVFTQISSPSTPPLPDYPEYYNIMVEECEGATIETSTNVVREGNSVTFTIDIAEGYDAENMTVKFKRSLFGYWETATPDEDGTYQIRNIYTDIYIMVEGVAEENPTGIEQIEGAQVYTRDGSLFIRTPQPEQVLVISASGAILKNERFAGLRRFDNLQRGVYIICIGNERFKVRI